MKMLSAVGQQRAIDNALDALAADIRIDFLVTTQTWDHEVVFVIDKDDNARSIYTTDPPYIYVAHGTRVRYAHMTPDFVPKTTPEQILSNAGQGGFAFLGKPLPGIRARDFDKVIARKWADKAPSIFLAMLMVEAGH